MSDETTAPVEPTDPTTEEQTSTDPTPTLSLDGMREALEQLRAEVAAARAQPEGAPTVEQLRAELSELKGSLQLQGAMMTLAPRDRTLVQELAQKHGSKAALDLAASLRKAGGIAPGPTGPAGGPPAPQAGPAKYSTAQVLRMSPPEREAFREALRKGAAEFSDA